MSNNNFSSPYSYSALMRRNQDIVTREGGTLIWKHSAVYGLVELPREETTQEFRKITRDLRNRVENGKLTLGPDEIEELQTNDVLARQVLTKISDTEFLDLTLTDSVPWLRSFTAIKILGAKVMGIQNWEEIFSNFEDTLSFYGDILKANKEDRRLSHLVSAMNQAEQEHNSSAHLMMRCLSANWKIDDSFVIFVSCTLLKNTLQSFANGTQMPACVVSLSTPRRELKTKFHVMLQGQSFFRSESLMEAYAVFFIMQNILMLESAPGKKSIAKLVEAINRMIFNVKYRKDTVGKKLDRFLNLLKSMA